MRLSAAISVALLTMAAGFAVGFSAGAQRAFTGTDSARVPDFRVEEDGAAPSSSMATATPAADAASAPAPERPGAKQAQAPSPQARQRRSARRVGPALGLWERAREARQRGDAMDRETLDELANLPYLSGYEEREGDEGVVVIDQAAQPGFNLIVSGHAAEAALCELGGRVLHHWSLESEDYSAERAARRRGERNKTFFRRAYVYPDGDLLAIYDGFQLVRLDRESNVKWRFKKKCHHDLFVDDEGLIHVLGRRVRRKPDALQGFAQEGPIWEDQVFTLTGDGNVVRRVSLLECFVGSDYASLLAGARRDGDVMHTNTLEILDGRYADRYPVFGKDRALISSPTINAIAVVDLGRREVVWAMTGMWEFQHEPSLVDGGRILLFDNRGHGGDSKVIEFDPATQEVTWSYRSSPEQQLFSAFLGASHRLENGNTLIVESTQGRALEVTRAGEIVWEYLNPHRAGEDGEFVATLLDVVRLPPDYFDDEFVATWD
ncbi:MAG: arylsulfotransferase family protein [Planctomycetota bacterium]